jgi:hypothetical protein
MSTFVSSNSIYPFQIPTAYNHTPPNLTFHSHNLPPTFSYASQNANGSQISSTSYPSNPANNASPPDPTPYMPHPELEEIPNI